jgi:hypothetical protein
LRATVKEWAQGLVSRGVNQCVLWLHDRAGIKR